MDKWAVTMTIVGAMCGVVLGFIVIIAVLDIMGDGKL